MIRHMLTRSLLPWILLLVQLAGTLPAAGAAPSPGAAVTPPPAALAEPAAIRVFADGREVVADVAPLLQAGRVFLPVRAVFGALGADVEWDGSTSTVTARRGDTEVRLTIDSPQALVNGRIQRLAAPAFIHQGRTMAPLRFAAEALGAAVLWAPITRSVWIRTAPASLSPAETAFRDLLAGTRWVAYSPTHFNPETGMFPLLMDIRSDLQELRNAGFDGLITYDSEGVLGEIPRLAAELGFRAVIAGLWLPTDVSGRLTSSGWQALVNAVAAASHVIAYGAGHEGLGQRYSRELLEEVMTILRASGRRVSTSEELARYTGAAAGPAGAAPPPGDWLFPVLHPWHHGMREPDRAAAWVAEQLDTLAVRFPGQPVLAKEAGFPAGGDPAANEEAQTRFFQELLARRAPAAWFEAFDQPWKTGGVEPHWGLFDAQRRPRSAVQALPPALPDSQTPGPAAVQVRLDQQIGIASVSALLQIDTNGIRYKNDQMAAWRSLPWPAILSWRVEYGGFGIGPAAAKEFSFLRLHVDNTRLPDYSALYLPQDTLVFRVCCQRQEGDQLAAHLRALHPTAEVPTVPGLAYRLSGLNFSPYLGTQDPNRGARVDEAQLRARLETVAPYAGWIRTFGSGGGLEAAGKIAHALELRIAMGAWLGRDSAANQREMDGLLAAARTGQADVLVVGNEVLLRGDLSEDELLDQIARARAIPGAKVTTVEPYSVLLSHPAVLEAVDVVYANFYPFWEGVAVDQAVAALHGQYQRLKAAARGKEVVVAETRWPSAGEPKGEAVPSAENAVRYALNFLSWARASDVKYFYFEAFDEDWKAAYEGERGRHWGVWDGNGRLKPGLDRLFRGETVADNWSGAAPVDGPGKPAIAFTRVPPRGSTDPLQGRVRHVAPRDYRVAVYIEVGGGWWTKPYWAEPLTDIRPDGTWSAATVTGGDDAQAGRIVAFLLPASYDPPIARGELALPAALLEKAAASTEVTRAP